MRYRQGSLRSVCSWTNNGKKDLAAQGRSTGKGSSSSATSGNYSGAERVVRPVVVVMVGFKYDATRRFRTSCEHEDLECDGK